MTCVKPEEEDTRRVIQIVEEMIRADERDPYNVFTNRVTRIKYGNSYFYKVSMSDVHLHFFLLFFCWVGS